MSIEAMKLALEALEDTHYSPDRYEAITSLRQAIEQAQKQQALDKKAENAIELGLDYEPIEEYDFRRIAFEYRNASTQDADHWFKRLEQANVATNDTTQERVDETAKQRHEPLTDEELKPICDEYRILFGDWVHDFARAIEAKLKEKNNA